MNCRIRLCCHNHRVITDWQIIIYKSVSQDTIVSKHKTPRSRKVSGVFLLGRYGRTDALWVAYYKCSQDSVIRQIENYCIPLLAVAAVLGIAYTVWYYGENYAMSPAVNSPLAIAYAWIACLAILGGAKHCWDKTNSFTAFMAKKSFGLYVFHYLALSATAYVLVTYTSLPGIAIYGITLIAAFVGGILIYEVVSRIPVVRWCVLGIKKEKKNVQG